MKGLAAYSAGSALNNLRKGKYKQAGLDALGVIPGGKIYKGVRALGGAKKLAQVGSATQSLVRHGTDNAFNKAYNKTFDTGAKIVTAPFRGKSANANTNTNSNSNTNKRMSSKPKSQTSNLYNYYVKQVIRIKTFYIQTRT